MDHHSFAPLVAPHQLMCYNTGIQIHVSWIHSGKFFLQGPCKEGNYQHDTVMGKHVNTKPAYPDIPKPTAIDRDLRQYLENRVRLKN
jgi:hypothetical protein